MITAKSAHLTILTSWPLAILLAGIAVLVSVVAVVAYCGSTSANLLGCLLLAFCALLAWPLFSDVRRGCFDPLESRNVFVYLFCLYAASLPLLTYLRGESVSEVATTQAITKAFAITVLSTVFFQLAYGSGIGERISSALPTIGQTSISRLRGATIAVVICVALWFGAFLFSIGGLRTFLATGYSDIYELDLGKEYLSYSLNVIPVCALLLLHLANCARSRLYWIGAGFAVASTLLLLLSGSRRRLMITLVLSLLVYFHYAIKRVSTKALLTLGVVAAVGVSGLGVLRAIPVEELTSRHTVEFLADRSPSELLYVFLESGEPAGDFETFPFLIQQISAGTSFQWGRTYFEAPLILIPRILYPNRPLTASQWYADKFFPEVARDLGGRPLFFLGEAYLNFGVLGPPALMLLVGIACRILYLYLKRDRFGPGAALIYAAVIGTFPSAIRIDFATTLKVSLGSALPVAIFVLWYARKQETSTVTPLKT